MFPVATLYFITFSSTDFFSMIKDEWGKNRKPVVHTMIYDKLHIYVAL